MNYKRIVPCLIIAVLLQACATAPKGSKGVNAPEQQEKPYLVLISIDGFRHDFREKAHTPAMDALAERGISAHSLDPVFPTLTFPNHYSIATGLYPNRHGIVANEFPGAEPGSWFNYKEAASVEDGSWFGGEPVWVAAEKAGMVTASYFWVGSEAPIQGIRPTHWYPYDVAVPGARRVDKALDWLAQPEETRPHLVTLYFEDVDNNTHWYGIDSEESIKSIERVDGYLQRLMDGIAKLPHADEVYIVLVSDHGQAPYEGRQNLYRFDSHLRTDNMRFSEGGPYLFVFYDGDQPERIPYVADRVNRSWVCGHAYLPDKTPGHWRVRDNERFPELILMAQPGCAVVSNIDERDGITRGDHGWPPEMEEMKGFFIAAGPGLPAGTTGRSHSVVDVYPLLMKILGLPIQGEVDGDSSLSSLLETP